MRRDDWTRQLIDRIEAVRDMTNAADTRIKLMPDALGKIDVTMRKDGDTMYVSFTADVAATRALRSEEHTSELQSLMRISYAVFCCQKKIEEQKRERQHK